MSNSLKFTRLPGNKWKVEWFKLSPGRKETFEGSIEPGLVQNIYLYDGNYYVTFYEHPTFLYLAVLEEAGPAVKITKMDKETRSKVLDHELGIKIPKNLKEVVAFEVMELL